MWSTGLTCSSFIIIGRSCDSPSISSKLSNSPFEFLLGTFTGPSPPAFAPSGGQENPSTPRQLLSAEAGRGAKSEANESSGSPADVCRKDPDKPVQGLRITPALVLLGIHRAKKSAWEKWIPARDDIMTSSRQIWLIWDLNDRLGDRLRG